MPAPKSLLKGFAKTVATAKPDPDKRLTLFDPDTRGFALRITPKGRRTFTIVARDPSGKQVWREVGDADEMELGEARAKAREGVKRIKAGDPPFPVVEPPPAPDTFKAVAETYLKRHVVAKGLRSESEIRRILEKLVFPTWQNREFESIRRSDVAKLLDEVEDKNGAVQADRVLSMVRGVMNFYAIRSDNYVPPIARGMRRSDPKERQGKRTLTDGEIRALWKASGDSGAYGAMTRLALLSGQRREKCATIKWSDIDAGGVWTIATEEREKGNGESLLLPALAVAVIRAQKRIEDNPYVFPGRGGGHLAGYSKLKASLDGRVLAALKKAVEEAGGDPATVELKDWDFHDLRRTARSLMSRAGIDRVVAERVLGHAIGGIEGIYDRHKYEAEKADALERLAALIGRILNPPSDNVVTLREGVA